MLIMSRCEDLGDQRQQVVMSVVEDVNVVEWESYSCCYCCGAGARKANIAVLKSVVVVAVAVSVSVGCAAVDAKWMDPPRSNVVLRSSTR